MLAVAQRYSCPIQSHIARGVLEEHGVEATVWHENAVSIYGVALGQFSLVVAKDDLPTAREVLAARPEIETSQDGALAPWAPIEVPPWSTLVVAGVILALFALAAIRCLWWIGQVFQRQAVPPMDVILARVTVDALFVVAPLGALCGLGLHVMFLFLNAGLRRPTFLRGIVLLLIVIPIALALGS